MKDKINRFIDSFEERFNFIVDITALVGATFTILLGVFVFIMLIFDFQGPLENVEYIIPPGILGFLGILMLFALRVTRHLTKESRDEKRN